MSAVQQEATMAPYPYRYRTHVFVDDVAVPVEIEINLDGLARKLVRRAVKNKSGKSILLNSTIRVKVQKERTDG